MSAKEQAVVVILLLIVFLYHYIRLSIRVRRLEKGIVYVVSPYKGFMTAVSFADRNLDGSLDYETDLFNSGRVYSLSDAREIAKLCDGAVVNKHTKEIIEDYRECVDKQSRWWYYKYIKIKGGLYEYIIFISTFAVHNA